MRPRMLALACLLLTVPYGAETCGPWIHGDNKSAFVAVQHPGEISGASVERPAAGGISS